ncbi:MAG: HTH-type transcriptional regulator AscG [Verrucomicrobia bacterium ADurb.Bin345]|nr:MAG: HTH-type transcriptional regulator AscG [Verrucomicrobia bacterium ADurb.Bin345]
MKASRAASPDRPVTTKDIAEATGLSKMTVSRVLNKHPYVSADARRRVEQAIRKLGFQPNALAKRFFTGKTRLIGVVIPLEYMFVSLYFRDLFQGVLERAEEAGYDILLHNSTSKKIAPLEKCMNLVKGKLAEGLLLVAPMSFDTYPLKLADEGVPLVVMGESGCGNKVHRVAIPNRSSSYEAVSSLVARGHRKIAALTFDETHVESQERLAGYRDALAHARVAPDEDLVVPAQYDRMIAHKQVQRLMRSRPDVTAIFALNADMAIGAADALRDMGFAIPGQVSLVSFDDNPEMEQGMPPIAAVRQFPHKLGYTACDFLIRLLAGSEKADAPQTLFIETEFVERGSVGPARKP